MDFGLPESIDLEKFQNNFPIVLKNMENLNFFALRFRYKSSYPKFWEYIAQNYANHCVSACTKNEIVYKTILDFVPIKCFVDVKDLICLENKKYISNLQYLHIIIVRKENPMDLNWDRYRDIFDQCINLKEIEISELSDKNFVTEILPTLSNTNQKIWKERLSYFQARGILMTNECKFSKDLKKFEKKVAKEAGLKWRFRFC